MPPRISIITVVYNAVDTLEFTIRSVVNQTYADHIQYIIIDGASTDGTLELIDKYKSSIDVLVSEKDEGIYDAMNKGLRYAKGDWVYFLGADDLLLSQTTIAELAANFQKTDCIYYGDTYLKSSNRLYNGKATMPKFLLCNISHQAIFYPRSVYTQKIYNTKYKYFADHVHNMELFASDRNCFIYLPITVSVYNDKGRSSTFVDVNYGRDVVKIVRENFGLLPSWYVWLRRKVARFKNSLLKK